jgi:ArsR family transcriptional regulator, arsenate/arsenite/antimonite-responsive transcriptional repressor
MNTAQDTAKPSILVYAYTGNVKLALPIATDAAPPAGAVRVRGCCNEVAPLLPDRDAEDLARLHAALSDPTRVQMVHVIAAAASPVCVCDLVAAFDLSQPTISHHLARLRAAGIIQSRKHGIWTFHALNPEMTPAARDAVAAVRAASR